ncbi:hypothetical protein Pcinc_042648 [Petrolisthes cinctipes]|uniref:Ubiquitin carboxyl-terminal hydrolase MINDY n=1 Tax=Petrolisthes cinctipes TaxID=88211 RepID=A0AAE1BI06_PETCI|nr:hypothetical protein Pcinc_042648 [Petrolisthes cinctipes]
MSYQQPEPEEEDEAVTAARSQKRRSFQKLVKKVVHTQTTARVADHRRHSKHVLYPSRSRTCIRQAPIVGGEPISSDTATELRMRVFGAADLRSFSLEEWLLLPFSFNDAGSPQAYGLRVHSASTKGMAMCVQAYLLKHLLFSHIKPSGVGDVAKLLKTTRRAQVDGLVSALADILWLMGEKKHAVLCLVQEDTYVNEDPEYMDDGCTEKLVTFEFERYEELKFTLKKYIYELVTEGHHGMLLFLYSVVLSRSFPRLSADLEGEECSLVMASGTIHPCLVTLLLTGRATKYLHNGIVYEGSEDKMAIPKTGILVRSEIGLLVWNRQESDENRTKVGSRLKTPTLPIWVTRCNDSYGVLFNPNRDLIRDYHAENRFDLYYYSSNPRQTTSTVLTIDTRSPALKDDHQRPPLESIVHTKWMDADVSWNGTMPYV